MGRLFHVATDEEIKNLKVVDVYFLRTVDILRKAGIRKHVVAEVTASSLPEGSDWAVLAGVEELAHLLEGVNCTVYSMPEGTVFGLGEPVVRIEGEYTEFAAYETPLLGVLCQASGVATKAARCKKAAGERLVISFGARRMHPAIAPMIERSAYIGGCDGVAVVKSAEVLAIKPVGTMPHALTLVVGDPVRAFKLFDEHTPSEVPRVCLVDTLFDEKTEAVRAAEALGERLYGVRLDTPGSRRGNIRAILEEVRWELDVRGYNWVKLFLSGGVDEYEIAETCDLVDAYGVGTSISNAPVINFAMDIVEVEGSPFTKRGKKAGTKQVWRCKECLWSKTLPVKAKRPERCERCGGEVEPLLQPLTEKGKLVQDLASPQKIREYVLWQLQKVQLRP